MHSLGASRRTINGRQVREYTGWSLTQVHFLGAPPRLVVEPDHRQLFLSPHGEPLAPIPVAELVRECIVQSGVAKPGSCDLFRHTMATLMLEDDIRFIQERLGHANLLTT